ncbi:MAG: hypothetical protein ACK42Z_04510 [Candidatus Kapaibacteriota bacterium]
MAIRKFFTIFLFLIVAIFTSTNTFSQRKDAHYYLLNFERNPLHFYDTCLYFPERIFTMENFLVGIKFAQPLTKKETGKENGKYFEIKNDTTFSKSNRIISIREVDKGDKMAIYLQVENKEQRIKIWIYNLLGKKVLEIYDGKPKDPTQPYEFSTNELPKGIFLLVVYGDNFRLREKLVITK